MQGKLLKSSVLAVCCTLGFSSSVFSQALSLPPVPTLESLELTITPTPADDPVGPANSEIMVDGTSITVQPSAGGRDINVSPSDDVGNPGINVVIGEVSDFISGEFSDLTILTGNGRDVIDVSDLSLSGDLEIQTGRGADTVNVEGLTVDGDLFIQTRRGNDAIAVDDLMVFGQATIGGGANSDDVTVNNSVFAGGALLSGGIGRNDVLAGEGVMGDVVTQRFESDFSVQETSVEDEGVGEGLFFFWVGEQ